MKNQQQNSRRNVLKAAASSGVLSGLAWTTPVVNSVILPAHAQMSPTLETFFGQTNVVVVKSPLRQRKNFMDLLVEPVNAGTSSVVVEEMPPESTLSAYAMQTGEDEFNIQIKLVESRRCKTLSREPVFNELIAFAEGTATGGSGMFTSTHCPSFVVSGTFIVEFDYEVVGETLVLDIVTTGDPLNLEEQLILASGGEPLTNEACTDCPDIMQEEEWIQME